MRISDWSSDVCSSDLPAEGVRLLFRAPVDRNGMAVFAALLAALGIPLAERRNGAGMAGSRIAPGNVLADGRRRRLIVGLRRRGLIGPIERLAALAAEIRARQGAERNRREQIGRAHVG